MTCPIKVQAWLLLTMLWAGCAVAAPFSADTHDVHPGDFNGDGKSDLLVIAKDPAALSGIYATDASGQPSTLLQSWNAGFLGISWHEARYTAVVGNFDGVNGDDVLLQRNGTGTSFLLPTNSQGELFGISQYINGWGTDAYRIIAGKFDGNARADVLLQARQSSGSSSVILSDGSGQLTVTSQTFANNHLGFKWSVANALVHAGDFNGDGRDDLLVQAKPDIALIDYDIPIPVPVFKSNAFGILLATPAGQFTSIHDVFNRKELGLDFAPGEVDLVIGDFNGDGREDVLLLARTTGKSSFVVLTDSNGQLAQAGVVNLGAGTLGAELRTLAGDFNGDGRAEVYRVASSGGGSNSIVSFTSAGGIAANVNHTPAGISAPTTAVGRTEGIGSVSDTGAASYVIPITTPSGTAGLTPQLAFVYSSNSGSSPVGVGWGVSGLSRIERCGSTWASNGSPRDVRGDAGDRFCLDGLQLKFVSGSAYGSGGTQYSTEIETFARIVSLGGAGAGPAYFTVERKDGLIYEYGNTAQSRVEFAGSSTVRTWAVNKIRDRSGNAILFEYEEDLSNGSYRIDSVQYTANALQGISAPYQVKFVYEALPASEVDMRFMAGAMMKRITRLDRVDVTHSGSLVRRYELTFETALSSTVRSRLASIQECAGSPTLGCLAATTFQYQNGSIGVSSAYTPGFSTFTSAPYPIDVNGDGRTDLVYPSAAAPGAGVWLINLANADGTYAGAINSGIPSNNYNQALPIDYNADGREDLLVPYSGGTWWVLLGTASGLASPFDTGVAAEGANRNARTMDVNGDGLEDLVWADLSGTEDHSLKQRLRLPNGTFSASVGLLLAPIGPNRSITNPAFSISPFRSRDRHPDVNGDGREDLVVEVQQIEGRTGTTVRYWVLVLGGMTNTFNFFNNVYTFPSSGFFSSPRFADLNGDGLSDLFYAIGTTWRFRFSRGGSLGPEQIGPARGTADFSNAVVMDWDSDSFEDVLLRNSDDALLLMRSTGEALQPYVATGQSLVGGFLYAGEVNGDGLDDLLHIATVGSIYSHYLHAGAVPDLLDRATDGFGNYTDFNYATLSSSGACYTRNSPEPTYPQRAFQDPLSVVCSTSANNGIGGSYTVGYQYYNATLNLQGRGFEGFGGKRSQDSRNGLYAYEYFNLGFPYTGTPSQLDVLHPNNTTLISRALNTWSTHSYGSGVEARQRPYVSSATNQQYEVGGSFNGVLVRSTATTNTVDTNTGTLTDTTTTVTEGNNANGSNAGATHTFRTYIPSLFNDSTNWCVGRPNTTQQINNHSGPGGAQLTRTQSTTWDGLHCRPNQRVIEPGNPQWQVTTDVGYDAFGNPGLIIVTPASGQGQSARTTQLSWGSDGRFPRSLTNPKSQLTQIGWHEALGLRASLTDANGLRSTWQYDAFGRMTRQQLADGTATDVVLASCSGGSCGASDLRSYVNVIARDTANTVVRTDAVYFNGFDQPRIEVEQLLSGASSTVTTTYDALGRASQISTPHIVGIDPAWYTTFTYDVVNRVTQIQRPVSEADTSTHLTRLAYQGLTTSATDALNRTTRRKLSSLGEIVQSLDALGNDTDYVYDAFGQLLKTRDVANNEITLAYNVRGFKESSNDPDLGAWIYTYYPLGELKNQTDARGNTVSFTYDALSRPLTRSEPEGTTTWTWDTATKGIGQLAAVSSPGGYAESYLYDAFGRPSQQGIVADGSTYFINQSYNSLGLLDTLTYPTSTAGVRFQVRYGYAHGQTQNVRDYTGNVLGTTFWQAGATNARGQLIDETLGNGVRTLSGYDRITGLLDTRTAGPSGGTSVQNLAYVWDKLGNLTQRKDLRQSLTEAFSYDPLNRLDFSTLNGAMNLDLAYDSLGNLTSKSDVGSYTYHPTKKHAVLTAGANSYTYDGNGNTITRNGFSLNWTSYNLPSLINGAGNNSSSFSYGPDRQRWKQTASYGGTTETTLYIGGLFEKVTLGADSWRHHILGPDGAVAIHTRKSSGVNETHYLSKDHLGSVDVITAASGAVEVRNSFSAFGQRRNAAGWTGSPTPADWTGITATTRRGYTGHEMLDNLNLTHMNGRVYDQITGRFLSADPLVPDPLNAQSFNRYSYVFNNPLSLIDPSGFSPDDPAPGGGTGTSGGGACDEAVPGQTVDGPTPCPGVFTRRGLVDGGGTPADIPPPRDDERKGPSRDIPARVSNVTGSGSGAWMGSTVGGSDFKSFALGFAAGIDFDLPTEEGEAYTEGFYAGLIANALTANIQDLKNGRVGPGSGRGSGSRRAASPAVNLSKSGSPVTSGGPPLRGGPNGGGSNPRRDFVLFHGTDVASARRLLGGEALNAANAAARKIDGKPGFFLATDADDAAYFAARRGEGTVLRYVFSSQAVKALNLRSSPLGNLGKFGTFLGDEVVISPEFFGTFNSLLKSGDIVIAPN